MQASVLCPFVPWLISILIYLRAKSKKRKITVSYWQMSDFALNWWMKQSWQLIIWARRRKGIVHFGQSTERGSLVRDSCAEEMEPALESCMKIQRNSGDNGKWESTVLAVLIRMVPPKRWQVLGSCDHAETGDFLILRCQGQKPETTMCLHRSGFMA